MALAAAVLRSMSRRFVTDAAAFWQHLAGRIKEACKLIEKMRALLPSDMRIKN